jgi:uncharacterized membrane protein required for colicin V production
MVQLSSLMWILAVFFGIVGFVRGWNREIVALAGISLAMFALFQFDPLIRGTMLLRFTRGQAFLIQVSIFLLVVFFAYHNKSFVADSRRGDANFQEGLLGGLVGMFNGYLIGGTLWYFLDINEYPLSPYVLADSTSAQSLSSIPLVIISGGVGGNGDMMIVGVVILFLVVLMTL